jgi:formamidopyrimidine-DNA glycosylase
MPELPEVENIALGLREVVIEKEVISVWVQTPIVLKGPGRPQWRAFLKSLSGERITAVQRRAKRLILMLGETRALVVQLGMTGKFLIRGRAAKRHKHTRMVLALEGLGEVHFIDTRRFGRIWLFPEFDTTQTDAAMETAGMGALGPEAPNITRRQFAACMQSARAVKALLLDQTRIAGLGNIYVDESLFAAGIHPSRRAESLNPEEIVHLHREIKAVLRRAIQAGGTTFNDYRNAYGDMGRFRSRLQVYGRAGEPCRACAAPIERLVLGGRGTHICPCCQSVERLDARP